MSADHTEPQAAPLTPEQAALLAARTMVFGKSPTHLEAPHRRIVEDQMAQDLLPQMRAVIQAIGYERLSTCIAALQHDLDAARGERDAAYEDARMENDRVVRLVDANVDLRAEAAALRERLALSEAVCETAERFANREVNHGTAYLIIRETVRAWRAAVSEAVEG